MNGKNKGYLLLICTFVLFGTYYVVSKFLLEQIPVFTISFFRFLIAFIFLGILGRKRRRRIDKKDYKYILFLGVVGYFGAIGLQFLGTKFAGAATASLLNSLNPITITFFAVLILNEKLTLKKVFGLVLAVIGINFIIGESQGNNILGISFSLMSVILWSIVSVMVRKISPKYDSLQLTYYGCGIATLCYLPLGISEQLSNFVNGKMQLGDFYAWLAIIYIGVICTGIAHYLWNYSLSTLEATVCSSFYPIQPLVSTILATWLLDESIQLSFLVGALLIITGILISLRKDVNFEGTLIE